MAQIPFRCNLQSMSFPMLSKLSGRTIINPQADQTYARFVSSDGQSPVDIGVPQIMYCHNVMPSTQGWQSISYTKVFNQTSPQEGWRISEAILFYGAVPSGASLVSTGYKSYLGVGLSQDGTLKKLFYINTVTKAWTPMLGVGQFSSVFNVTVATVNGVSYIYVGGNGCWFFNDQTGTSVFRVLAGLNLGTTLGIVSANGYLNAFNKTGVAWSSVINVEDFVPSDTSGAGGGQVQEAKGEIVTAIATNLGYILYTKENAVSVTYSGNAEFPWNFKAIQSAGGIASPDVVSKDQALGYQQMYSTNGLQQVSHAKCITVAPNITDFIAGNVFEDFNPATNTFEVTEFDWTMRKRIAVIADRYIILSYGLTPIADYTHAIVIDLTQNRLGKLKITHTCCFELRSLDSVNTEIPRDSIAMLTTNGETFVVNFSIDTPSTDSVLLIGKMQYVRQKLLELNQLEIENVAAGGNFQSLVLPSLNGKNFTPAVPGFLQESSADYRRYTWDGALGVNVSYLFKGTFNINSLVGWFSLVGNP